MAECMGANCENGGTCNTTSNKCECPFGFVGNHCEGRTCKASFIFEDAEDYSYIKNDGAISCYNGGKCSLTWSDGYEGEFFKCVCPVPTVELGATSGDYCQTVESATSMCIALSGNNDYVKIAQSDMFCTNGGSCKEVHSRTSEEFQGCDCPGGFSGKHCEIGGSAVHDPIPMEISNDGDDGGNSVARDVLLGLVISLVVLVGVWVVKRKVKSSRRKKRAVEMLGIIDENYDFQSDDELKRLGIGDHVSLGYKSKSSHSSLHSENTSIKGRDAVKKEFNFGSRTALKNGLENDINSVDRNDAADTSLIV